MTEDAHADDDGFQRTPACILTTHNVICAYLKNVNVILRDLDAYHQVTSIQHNMTT